MVTVCTITGVLRNPAGAALPNAAFTVSQAAIYRTEDGASLPLVLSNTADGNGAVSFGLLPGRYVLTWLPGPNAQPYVSPLSVPFEATADLRDLLVARDIPQRDPVGPAEDARDMAQAWAQGTEPGGPGTKSALEWAGEAEQVRQTLLDGVDADATTLNPGEQATASYDPDTKIITIGVPVGDALIYQNQSHLAALFGQAARETERLRAAQGETPPLSSAVGALASIINQLARQIDGGRIALAAGTLDDPALRIGTASVYSTAADTLSVAVAGVERLRITTSGITVFGTVTEV